MPEFLKLTPPPEALKLLLAHMQKNPAVERVKTIDALGRVTAEAIKSPISLPQFPRSTVDGYAVRATDTFGSSESLPIYLHQAGEVHMGATPGFDIRAGEAALIHTGGMLPDSCDAVVMVEYTQLIGTETIEILRPAAVGENTIRVGEDVQVGEEVIQHGVRIRPVEIGGLLALGRLDLTVARKPLVGLISTGDEVVSPESYVTLGQVRDINSYSLSALLERNGAIARRYGIYPDQADKIGPIAEKALQECDVLAITAGSSASARDLTSQVINSLGSPGILVHGVNIKPGKPTILAVCDNKVVIGLPGNPVSALVIAGFFLVPVVESLLGLADVGARTTIPARLTVNVPSQAGREDWVAARLHPYNTADHTGYLVDPIFSKSNLIFSLVRANCLIRVPPDATGLSAGDVVDVLLYS